ncbi:hypothetical protein FB45DRAFT_1116449 [Roridomyces roridus]|uniref:F-box domain-containing protein n=1 Tax=Roridomyces roridus TaxID=1738132 RepID=A0AAD7CC38_9AGAR|nr:hypothetical protein FB45DRAFT_1116449 [Roridomyces roridus]
MSAHDRVPNELWLEIFKLLPRDALKAVYSTARQFTTPSRALLFTHLRRSSEWVNDPSANDVNHCLPTAANVHRGPPVAASDSSSGGYITLFYPYDCDVPLALRDHLGLTGSDGVQSALDRLAFWSSDEIAPFVRECTVAPPRQGYAEPLPILMTSFMDALGKFTGLQKLSAHLSKLTQAGVAHLCRIPLLTEIVIEGCGIIPADTTIDTTNLELRTEKLVYRNGALFYDDRNLCLTIVHHGHLRELEVTDNGTGAASNTLAHGDAFPNVYKLTIAMNFSTMTQNLLILSKFPAVCELQLSGWEFQVKYESSEEPTVNVSDVLPLLREYRGPCTPLHLFLSKSTLARLVIDACPLEDFIFQFGGTYGHITALDATVYDLNQGALSTICSCLPALIDLRIKVLNQIEFEEDDFRDSNSVATDFFSTLANTLGLPSTLQRLAISWDFIGFDSLDDYDEGPVAWPEAIPDFVTIRDTLKERCPPLRTLWFDWQDFMFKWRQLLDRDEMEQKNEIEAAEIEDLRAKFEDFWEGRLGVSNSIS